MHSSQRHHKLNLFFSLHLVLSLLISPAIVMAGQKLSNGIVLPDKWPPNNGPLKNEPMPVPYLDNPPPVIPIDVGRQLFVDDFLIESITCQRRYNHAFYHPANPVLKPDKSWEKTVAMVYSDGVWYDPKDNLFKMWYFTGSMLTAYATSKDGITWDKPNLDLEPGTNIVLKAYPRDSSTVWLDINENDPNRRYKMMIFEIRDERPRGGDQRPDALFFSPDGIHWSKPIYPDMRLGDRNTFFYNPFRKVWVNSIRVSGNCVEDLPWKEGTWKMRPRHRLYREHPDLTAQWQREEIVPWVGADRYDLHHPRPEFRGIEPQLYNLDAVPYESLMLGLFSIWQGPEDPECAKYGIRKRNQIIVGFSRDGFHWYRPDRGAFIPTDESPNAWNWGNVQSAGGCCLVVGDNLYFYVSGRSLPGEPVECCTGLATLRRDGFASICAGTKPGTITTRPVTFKGKYLFVNVDTSFGQLQVEVLDKDSQLIAPLSMDNCVPISINTTLWLVKWKGVEDLSSFADKPVRFRFHLKNGSLYSFWVSPDESGASYGYVAAGGPGFKGPVDTLGRAAFPKQ